MKNLFLFNKKTENNNNLNHGGVDNYKEIAKLVKELIILGISNEYFEKTFFI